MALRKSDTPVAATQEYIRRSRFRQTPEGYFFMTREGVPVGPYETLFDAELSASLLIARLAQLDSNVGTLAMIQSYLSDPANPLAHKRTSGARGPSKAQGGAVPTIAMTAVQRAWAALREMSGGRKPRVLAVRGS